MSGRGNFTRRLYLLLAVPLAALVYVSVTSLVGKVSAMDRMGRLQRLAELSVRASALAHELQRERGMSAGFLGSRGAAFRSERTTQIPATDAQRRAFLSMVQGGAVRDAEPELRPTLDQTVSALAALDQLRPRVDALEVPAPEAIARFSELISLLLSSVTHAGALATDGALARSLYAYAAFLEAKERAGQERALLSNAFAQDRLEGAMLLKLSFVLGGQEMYLRQFLQTAEASHRRFYEERVRGEAVLETARLRGLALARAPAGGFGVDPKQWFELQTAKIDLMKSVEDRLARDLVEQGAAAMRGLAIDLAVHALITLLALGMTLFASRSMARSTLRFMQGLLQATGRLHTAAAALKETAGLLDGAASEQVAKVAEARGAIGEITAAISSNARSAEHTRAAAEEAVTDTGRAVQRIAERVLVVDEIAHRTNLLALNATIEAARAGTQGKAFAVVATEVRRLAERCRGAAADINEIATAGGGTSAGTGERLSDVVQHVRQTASLVDGITGACRQQAQRMEEVRQVMGQIDALTQRSASAAERLASTAGQLSDQASGLRALVNG